MQTSTPESKRIEVNGVELHVKVDGPENGDPIIFLHGFPEFWYAWHHQVDYFAGQDFRVIVPDQRGYNQSEKPEDVSSYTLDTLTDDIVELIDQLGLNNVTVVGHDWGGPVTWSLAEKHPDPLNKIVILNAPHPIVFSRYFKKHPLQILRSWYMIFFQLPYLPEKTMGFLNCFPLRSTLRRTSRPNTFSDEEMARYVHAWNQPHALNGMINWYRAAYQDLRSPSLEGDINLPSKIIWGKKDAFLDPKLAEQSAELASSEKLTFLDENTHWLHHEDPETVNNEIETFI